MRSVAENAETAGSLTGTSRTMRGQAGDLLPRRDASGRFARVLLSGTGEEVADLLVGRLREVVVPPTDAVEGLRRRDAHGHVGPRLEFRTGSRGRPTGTTTRAGSRRRRATTAARMEEPVARPSSTRMTVRPRTSGAGPPPRSSHARPLQFAPLAGDGVGDLLLRDAQRFYHRAENARRRRQRRYRQLPASRPRWPRTRKTSSRAGSAAPLIER